MSNIASMVSLSGVAMALALLGSLQGTVAAAAQPDPSAAAPREPSAVVLKSVQEVLTQRGFYSAGADGVWGPDTASAVVEFQRKNELEPTGQLDDKTIAALGLGKEDKEPSGTPTLRKVEE